MDSVRSPEDEPRKLSRREFGRKSLGTGGTLVFPPVLDRLGKIGKFIGIGQEQESKEDKLENSHEMLFRTLFDNINNINRSRGSQEDWGAVVRTAEELQRIISVNDVFMSSYRSNVTGDGAPRLKVLYEAKYSPYGVENPESMIFFVENDRLATGIIIDPLKTLNETLKRFGAINIGDIGRELGLIRRKVLNSSSDQGEGRFDRSLNVGLIDYLKVNTRKGGTLEVGTEGDVNTEAGKARLEEDVEQVKEIQSRFPIPGDIEVKLYGPERYTNEAFYKGQGGGRFIELVDRGKVEIPADQLSAAALLHELAGHGLDILNNDTQLFQYLSPEAICDLMVLREEALSSSEWGRHYPDVVRVFDSKARTREISPPGAAKLGNLRQVLDIYPDGIFITGFYNGHPLSAEKDSKDDEKWLQRRGDQSVIKEFRGIFEREDRKFDSLAAFLEENTSWINAMKEKSPWLAQIDSEIENLPEIGRTDWLPEVDFEVPKGEARAVDWFDYYIKIGQRAAVVKMLEDKRESINLLSESEVDLFRDQLLIAASFADRELFAEMMAQSLILEIIAYEPNPYLKYLGRISQELQARGTSITASQELMAAITRHSPVPHA